MTRPATLSLLAPSHWLLRGIEYVVQHAVSVVLLTSFASLLAVMGIALSLHVPMTTQEPLSTAMQTRQRQVELAFPTRNEITLRIDGEPAAMLSALADLEQELQQPAASTHSVVAYADTSAWRAKALHFFPLKTLQELEASLRTMVTASEGHATSIVELWPGYPAFIEQLVQLQSQFARTPQYTTDQRGVLVNVQLSTHPPGGSADTVALSRLLAIVNQFQRQHASIRITAQGELMETRVRFEQRWKALLLAMLLGAFGMVLFSFLGFGAWQPALLLSAAVLVGQVLCGGCVVLGLGSISFSQALGWLLLVPFQFYLCMRSIAYYWKQRRTGTPVLHAWRSTVRNVGIESLRTYSWLIALAGLLTATCQILDVPSLTVWCCSCLIGLFVQWVLLPALFVVNEERFAPMPAEYSLLTLSSMDWLPRNWPTFTRVIISVGICCALPGLHQLSIAFTRTVNRDSIEPTVLVVCESGTTARALSEQLASVPGVSRVDELASSLVPEEDAKRRMIVRIGSHLKQLLSALDNRSAVDINQAMPIRQSAWLSDSATRNQLELLLTAVSPEPPRSSDLPTEWLRRYVNAEGKYLVHITALPAYQHGANLGKLVTAIEQIAPHAAGKLIERWHVGRAWQTLWLRTAIVTLCGSVLTWLLLGQSLVDAFFAMLVGILSVLSLMCWAGYAGIPLVGEHWLALFGVWLLATMPTGSLAATLQDKIGCRLANVTALLFALLLSCSLTLVGDSIWQGLGQLLVIGLTGAAVIRWGLAWGASVAVWESSSEENLFPVSDLVVPSAAHDQIRKVRPRAVVQVHAV